MQKRKMILKFIDISFYGTLVIVEILAIVKPDIGNFILSTLWFLGAWAITFINYFSMRYIQACSKKVQSVGLEASQRFINLYVGLFFTASLCNTITYALGIPLAMNKDQKSDGLYKERDLQRI